LKIHLAVISFLAVAVSSWAEGQHSKLTVTLPLGKLRAAAVCSLGTSWHRGCIPVFNNCSWIFLLWLCLFKCPRVVQCDGALVVAWRFSSL